LKQRPASRRRAISSGVRRVRREDNTGLGGQRFRCCYCHASAHDAALGPAGRLEGEGVLVWPPGGTEQPPVSHVNRRS
jgi:hypothetical protein